MFSGRAVLKPRICTECGKTDNSENIAAAYRTRCGVKLPAREVMEVEKYVCSECGEEASQTQHFCSFCGGNITTTVVLVPAMEIQPSQPW